MRSTHESKVYTRTSRRLSCDNVIDMEKCKDSKINTYSLTFKERSLNVFFFIFLRITREEMYFSLLMLKKAMLPINLMRKREMKVLLC